MLVMLTMLAIYLCFNPFFPLPFGSSYMFILIFRLFFYSTLQSMEVGLVGRMDDLHQTL